MNYKSHKRQFVTTTLSDVRMQLELIRDDDSMTELQKTQALNRIEKAAQRQYGFYSEAYAKVKEMCADVITSCQKAT